MNKETEILIRNFIFGVEDSLVSTVGLLSGIAVAGISKTEIFLTGIVLIFVEAFSMGTGSFLSEHSVEEYETQKDVPLGRSIAGAIVMFLSYLGSGLIPTIPYAVLPKENAFVVSILFSLGGLFLLGIVSSQFFKIKSKRHVFEMVVLGGLAIGVGVAIGKIFDKF